MHKYIFFFKQKTAYEMRISDWSSDVCSSDLFESTPAAPRGAPRLRRKRWKRHPDPAVQTDAMRLAGCTEPYPAPSDCVATSAVARVPGVAGDYARLP